ELGPDVLAQLPPERIVQPLALRLDVDDLPIEPVCSPNYSALPVVIGRQNATHDVVLVPARQNNDAPRVRQAAREKIVLVRIVDSLPRGLRVRLTPAFDGVVDDPAV